VATVSMSGNSFTVTGVSAGMATVQVHDANGTPVQVLVTVK
jgi:L-serine deaminase